MASAGRLPSRLVVDFLRHAVVTRLVSPVAVLDTIGKADSVVGG